MNEHDKGPLLGKQVAGSAAYAPTLLFPVPREHARRTLPPGRFAAYGEDLWHAYELSWLNSAGHPRMFLGRIRVPAQSPNIIESKSLKLYLNSLNNHRFASDEEARGVVEADLSAVAGDNVSVALFPVDAREFDPQPLSAMCLDHLEVNAPPEPEARLLRPLEGDLRCHTHLLRSLCPVTAQPDWGTVVVELRGRRCEPDVLLAYLLAYRNHQEFHEQCVERIFTDLWQQIEPVYLSVHALYTRRGGLDICPWRCSEPEAAPQRRINRQ